MSEFQTVVKEGAQSIGRRILRISLIILLLGALGGAAYVWISGWTYSDGSRAGFLIKVSKKGAIFKTYEGQLNVGGIPTEADGSGVGGSIWAFSTTDDELYQRLQDLQGQKVKLYYKQRYRSFAWQGKTDYFVYRADVVESMQPSDGNE